MPAFLNTAVSGSAGLKKLLTELRLDLRQIFLRCRSFLFALLLDREHFVHGRDQHLIRVPERLDVNDASLRFLSALNSCLFELLRFRVRLSSFSSCRESGSCSGFVIRRSFE